MPTRAKAAPKKKPKRRTERVAVSGATGPGSQADRVLTFGFDRFVQELLAVPEPGDEGELARLGEGADFLLDLTNGEVDLDAPAGTPGDLASCVLDLTDAALDQAHRILAHEAYDEPPDEYHPDPQGRRLNSLLRLTDHVRDDDTFAGIRDALLETEPAEDPSVASGGELP
ncbi:hypothetical protein GBA65_21885 (plasmid) [Rubrobacter marinus]|uniref:Uncharacterized protein n=1 Tax=Rubrobacter marinus TaxID=2653852 RepID=A0A6G8Q3R3_9ACTN|nr:hypothetical protein [Rubrobacter marinus]QIN81088.1 hypothetical protein GBA65_21885 [Rubrobacter marinus]